jgi:hypothetical protein
MCTASAADVRVCGTLGSSRAWYPKRAKSDFVLEVELGYSDEDVPDRFPEDLTGYAGVLRDLRLRQIRNAAASAEAQTPARTTPMIAPRVSEMPPAPPHALNRHCILMMTFTSM